MRKIMPSRGCKGMVAAAAFAAFVLTNEPLVVNAIEAARPTLVVYVVENPALTSHRPTIGESIAVSELTKHGYRVLPSVRVANLALLCPRDVRGVWNTDRRMSFRRHFRAEVLWMAGIEYKLERARRTGSVEGTISVAARAFSAETGESLWYGHVTDQPFGGPTLTDAARQALGEILSAMVADFDRSPKIRAWVPMERPQSWPPDIPLIQGPPVRVSPDRDATRPPESQAADRSQQPYTGVIIQADHLRVRPSFRSGLYAERGGPVYLPEGHRMSWADSVGAARRQAGPRPLILKALSSDGSRIVLPDSDARSLQRERYLLDRNRVTVVVRPPGR